MNNVFAIVSRSAWLEISSWIPLIFSLITADIGDWDDDTSGEAVSEYFNDKGCSEKETATTSCLSFTGVWEQSRSVILQDFARSLRI